MRFNQLALLLVSVTATSNADITGILTFNELDCPNPIMGDGDMCPWGPIVDDECNPYWGFEFCNLQSRAAADNCRVYRNLGLPNGRYFLCLGGSDPLFTSQALTTHDEQPLTMYRESPWDFHEFRVNSVWNEGLILQLFAYSDKGETLYSLEVNLGESSVPQTLALNWTGIHYLEMRAYGGRNVYWEDIHPGPDSDFCFDDFKYAAISCPADTNHDVWVNASDVLNVLAAWGPADNTSPEDINNDGLVGVDDLLLIIDNWGFCVS